MATLDELVNVLYSDGVPMPGSDMSDDDALIYAKQRYPSEITALLGIGAG